MGEPTPDPGHALFGSTAYEATSDAAVEAAAQAWLEEQAVHPFIREVAERTMERLGLQASERVLDVGCGTGVFLPLMAAKVGSAGRVVGLDHSETFLAAARQRITDQHLGTVVSLVAGDAHHLPFDDDSFDAAHTERVLMHLEDPDAAIAELRRVVRPGGRVVSAEIHARGGAMDHPDHELLDLLTRTMVSQMRNPWMGLELRRRFVSAGLEGVQAQAVIFVEDVLDPEEGIEVRTLAQALAVSGEIDPAAVGIADSMTEASERGMHCGYALMFIAVGLVPEAI